MEDTIVTVNRTKLIDDFQSAKFTLQIALYKSKEKKDQEGRNKYLEAGIGDIESKNYYWVKYLIILFRNFTFISNLVLFYYLAFQLQIRVITISLWRRMMMRKRLINNKRCPRLLLCLGPLHLLLKGTLTTNLTCSTQMVFIHIYFSYIVFNEWFLFRNGFYSDLL